MKQKILKLGDTFLALSVLNIPAFAFSVFYLSLESDPLSLLAFLAYASVALLTILIPLSIYGLIKTRDQTYTFLGSLCSSLLPVMVIGLLYTNDQSSSSFGQYFGTGIFRDFFLWSPVILMFLLIFFGLYLNYRRTGKIFD